MGGYIVPRIIIKRGNLSEHDPWNRHNLAHNMGLWDFSYAYAVNTMDIDQHIDGIKEFYNFPVLPVGFPIEDTQAANKFYVDYAAQNAVTFENLFSNGDVGTNADQVARGNHTHDNLPTDDEKDALDTAQDPSAGNPFITYGQFASHANRHHTVGQDKIPDVTALLSGLMSAADKILLDGLSGGGTFRKVEVFTISTQNVIPALADTPITTAITLFAGSAPTIPNVDWSISVKTITWDAGTAGYNLDVGDIVVVDYNYV